MDDVLSNYRLLAEQEDWSAQFNLGVRYEIGLDVKQDYEQAIYWYQKAAEHGHAPPQNNLGGMYEQGHGVEQDYSMAVQWFRLAANQGHAAAQANLGDMHKEGLGVYQDHKECVQWYRLASLHEVPDPQALVTLSIFYLCGFGSRKIWKWLFAWYDLPRAKDIYPP